MKIHVKTKHGESHKSFPCIHCDYKATQKGNLKKHIEAVHDDIKFKCKICGVKMSQKGYLKRHIKSKHVAQSKENQDTDSDYGFKGFGDFINAGTPQLYLK